MYVLELIRRYNKQEFKMDICVLNQNAGLLADMAKNAGSEVHICPGGSRGLRSFAKSFKKIIKDGEYDVVISHRGYSSGFVLLAAAWAGVKVRICHPHSLLSANMAGRSLLAVAGSKIQKKLTMKYATGFIGISQYLIGTLFGLSQDNKKCSIIPCGAILQNNSDSDAVRKSIRAEFGIKEGTTVVGHVGLFAERKNHAFFVRAAEVLAQNKDYTFLLVGEGPLEQSIKEMVAEKGLKDRFIFAGWQENVSGFMAAMDVMLFPSKWEGFPISVIEANANGLPVAVSDLPLFDEALSPEAQWCRFPLDNPARAAEIVNMILASKAEYEKLAKAARIHGIKFDISNSVKKFELFLKEQVNNTKKCAV